jgi:hypothetical protein
MLEQQYQKRAAYFLFLLVAATLGFSSLSNAQDEEETTTSTTTVSDEPAAPDSQQQTTQTTTTTEEKKNKLSRGGLFLEPMLTASQEDTSTRTESIPSSGPSSGRVDGYGVGFKLGGHLVESIFLGLDARYTRSNLDDPFFASNADIYNVGPTIGIQTPYAGIRLLGTYVLAGEANPSAGRLGIDTRFRNPRGWRVGAGVYIRRVGLNLEYQDLTYSNADIQSFGTVPVDEAVRVNSGTRGYTLSLSFPISL